MLYGNILLRIDQMVRDDFVNGGRCYVTAAAYTHATIEQQGYETHF
jgi:hypothetical protein